jgi:hypothetical protein
LKAQRVAIRIAEVTHFRAPRGDLWLLSVDAMGQEVAIGGFDVGTTEVEGHVAVCFDASRIRLCWTLVLFVQSVEHKFGVARSQQSPIKLITFARCCCLDDFKS